jgi:hypothetical protein
MAAPKGNEFWKLRSKHGPNYRYPPDDGGAEKLWADCIEYFEWCIDNPLHEQKVHGKDADVVELEKMRAFTMMGLCLYLGIGESTWAEWRADRKDLTEVITRAELVIREQKFTGAAANLLNANIIARDLALSENVNATVTHENWLNELEGE